MVPCPCVIEFPFASVYEVNVYVFAVVALNLNTLAGVDNPPDAVKKFTCLTGTPSTPSSASLVPSVILESAGSVTPPTEIEIVPDPSELIVAPPKLIVSPERNKSTKRFVELPKFLVPFPSGMISWSTADKSNPPIALIVPLSLI